MLSVLHVRFHITDSFTNSQKSQVYIYMYTNEIHNYIIYPLKFIYIKVNICSSIND